jgi:integrase
MVMTGRSARRALYVVSGLSGFYSQLGMGSPPLVAPVIEAYCANGLSGRHSSTKGTYRSVLRHVSEDPRPKVAPSFPGSRAKPPYSLEERAELYSIARAQRSAWRRRSALVLICLSMGAGLRSGEVVQARAGDVALSDGGVAVHVTGRRRRVVQVDGEAALVLSSLSKGAGTGHLFHPGEADRSYHNFVNNFCCGLTQDPGSPKLSVARLRSSFVCHHLASGTKLTELLRLTGIVEVESLLYYSCHVEGAPHSKPALRAALADE